MTRRPELGEVVTVPTGLSGMPASDVEGWDLAGRARTLRLASPGRWTLLLFLGSHCDGCLPFWAVPGTPRACGLELQDTAIVVTRGPGDEEPGALAALVAGGPAGAAEHLVLSDAAWRAYRVHGPPFFVLLDGVRVVTEGVAWSVGQVAGAVARVRRPPPGGRTTARA